MREERRPATGRNVGHLEKYNNFSWCNSWKDALFRKLLSLPSLICQTGKWDDRLGSRRAKERHTMGRSVTAGTHDICKAKPTMSHTHQQTRIRVQLRFSLRDGDEMQSGTLMTQGGVQTKGNISTRMMVASNNRTQSVFFFSSCFVFCRVTIMNPEKQTKPLHWCPK